MLLGAKILSTFESGKLSTMLIRECLKLKENYSIALSSRNFVIELLVVITVISLRKGYYSAWHGIRGKREVTLPLWLESREDCLNGKSCGIPARSIVSSPSRASVICQNHSLSNSSQTFPKCDIRSLLTHLVYIV